MNRFKLLFLAMVLMVVCLLFSTNVVVNAVVLFVGLCVFLLLFMYIEDTMNEKEKTFFNKWFKIN